MTQLNIRLVLVMILCALLAACSGGGGGGVTQPPTPKSKVTIEFDATRKAMPSPGAAKAAPAYAAARITVTGPGMDTLTLNVALSTQSTQTVTDVTLEVPNGSQRLFTVDLLDPAGLPAYSGKALPIDLDGTPVTLTINVSPMFLLAPRLEGTARDEYAYAMARDANGNLVIAGITYGDFSSPTSAPSVTANAFIVKYDASGQKLWTKQIGDAIIDTAAYSVAADGIGNIIITGITGSNLFGQTNQGNGDCFVSKFDPSGNHLWTSLIGGPDDDFGNAVAVDAGNNIYVTGQTYGTLTGAATAGLQDAFVAKFDPAGNRQWLRQFGSGGTDSGESVAIDPYGYVFVAGFTDGSLDGNGNIGSYDLFISRFDPQGNNRLTKQLGSTDSDQATSITIVGGSIYVAGNTFGNLDGKLNLDASGNTSDIFVIKYSASFVKQATWLFGTAQSDKLFGVAVDSTGSIYLSGSTAGAFAGYTNSGGLDCVVIKLQSAGIAEWTRQISTSSTHDDHNAIAIDSLNGVVLSGSATGTFDGVPSNGGYDAFLMSYDRTGAQYTGSQAVPAPAF